VWRRQAPAPTRTRPYRAGWRREGLRRLVGFAGGHTSGMDDGGVPESVPLAGRYELGFLLGRGGMGAVHDATDLRLRRRVAVKILRPDLAEQPTARRRFENEALAAARLVHPNVVTVFDSGEVNGVPFIVMERLPGRTLADELAVGPLSVDRARAVAREILSAVEAAHAAGIIHRDIKPGNVLLTDDNHVKVSDFGIAKTVDDMDQTLTTDLVATPGYLAPERLAGEPASPRSDLYSVGVLLYVALSGRRPFEGDTPLAVMRAIERGCAESLSSVRPALPSGVIAAVERAMSRDPRLRFDSAAEMAAALASSAELDVTVPIEVGEVAEETVTVPADGGSGGGATQILPVPSPEGDDLPRNPPRPRLDLRAVGIGAALAVVLLLGIAISERSSGHSPISGPATTTPAGPVTASTTRLPASLDDAIRKLEQAVAK
jgi:serine/threonine protein kinase